MEVILTDLGIMDFLVVFLVIIIITKMGVVIVNAEIKHLKGGIFVVVYLLHVVQMNPVIRNRV